MKLSIDIIWKLSKIKNSVYDAIKIEYLYHSNKLEESTFNKENLIDLLEQKQVVGEYFLDDVIEKIFTIIWWSYNDTKWTF